ncbi:hypothetical protein DAEQUDRAFT_270977 [Daedalea quercina L-15889]|uniref:Uncharacterized protein n=1 Tax=Daedalea quercina L-15889 TaxID=1314783 RepID=A0A165QCC9_9APHY|nr:hypothetical protein DAEQUDRAFT_270977 [Daedalea quercina L-15889]
MPALSKPARRAILNATRLLLYKPLAMSDGEMRCPPDTSLNFFVSFMVQQRSKALSSEPSKSGPGLFYDRFSKRVAESGKGMTVIPVWRALGFGLHRRVSNYSSPSEVKADTTTPPLGQENVHATNQTCHESTAQPQSGLSSSETNSNTLEYISASSAFAELQLASRGKRGRMKHDGTEGVVPRAMSGAGKFVPGEGVLRLEGLAPVLNGGKPKCKASTRKKQKAKPSRAPKIQSVAIAPSCRRSKPTAATAQCKTRHSGDPLVVQNAFCGRPRGTIPPHVAARRAPGPGSDSDPFATSAARTESSQG